MNAQLRDLDNLSVQLRSAVATDLAARRTAWRDMTPRQQRTLTRAAVREFRAWLEDRREHGQPKPA